ncbi:hypothetical protein I6G56_32375 [Burkholderia humptydooensis]|uniref:Uncharacterized protein n=1 Tax=Burkholderia humptydooensis TaxID=430531 RepID=A0A7T2U6R5_9BURK|nr:MULTISPECIES: hypothetical protein [Burkholderia]QPS46731.1 hypothetical protein I6G56_32375 [Burkholderia humptydooensis]
MPLMRETTGIESARERLRLPGLKPARFAKAAASVRERTSEHATTSRSEYEHVYAAGSTAFYLKKEPRH